VTGRKIPVSVEKIPVGTKNGNFQKKVGRSKIVTGRSVEKVPVDNQKIPAKSSRQC
jgi:hypothetical protein